MAVPFGGQPLTFKRVLDALRARTDCAVTVQAEAGIRGLGGSESGVLYYVERRLVLRKPPTPSEIRYTHIEVFHDDVVVFDERLRTICRELGLDEDELRRAVRG